MRYFESIPDKASRIGKVIGDIIAALIYLAVVLICSNIMYKVV